ncbi:glycosyltransferase family 39 protein [Microbacterium sp. X-17]|uniref:ArnT family glycosyltransferase n=1 Tax=Microbacterium sp. X-17 TaxID=3144404 RepID=UPI0031F5171A
MTALADRPPLPAAPPAATLVPRLRHGWTIGILLLTLATLLLTTWAIATGSQSDYYAAIALSMSKSWPNFFFGALDPAGTVTLDKIPGSFWIPALFVKVFGFSTWAVILPNALAAVGATLLVAVTARRLAGTTAGLVAGTVVATTPILIAVSRSNQPESFFVLGLALTAWAAVRALDRRSLGWLVTAGLFVALSFQMYMLEAWAVWPALAIAYLLTAQPLLRRIWHLAVAGVISLATSVVWIVIVSLVPASARPYIGSTLGNSAWEMVFGYNGLGRFGATSDTSAYRSFTPPFSGSPGVFRLFNTELAGQIAWLVPATLVAIVVLAVLRFRRTITVLLGVWFLTFAAMFSVVGGMHQFYTAALAVPMGLALATAFAHARRLGVVWAQAALVAAAAITALGIGFASGGYSVPVAIAQAVAAAAAVGLFVWEKRRARTTPWVAALAVVGVLLTPATWSVVTVAHPSATNPVAGGVPDIGGAGGFGAGPARAGAPGRPGAGQAAPQGRPGTDGSAPGRPTTGRGPGGPGGFAAGGFGSTSASTELISYLRQHRSGAEYLVAVFGAQTAAPLILASGGDAVLPIGGFDGQDPAPTLAEFEDLVQSGRLHEVLMGSTPRQGGGLGFGGGTGSSTSDQIQSWVQQNCAVDANAPSASGELYVCG